MSSIKNSQNTILQEEVELKTKIIWGENRELRFTDKNKPLRIMFVCPVRSVLIEFFFLLEFTPKI